MSPLYAQAFSTETAVCYAEGMLHVLAEEKSIITQYLHELRDVDIQNDASRFEHNLERLGMLLGYEISRQLAYQPHKTTTPLGTADSQILEDQVVINTILRAGLPVQRGMKTILDSAQMSFIAAGRKPETSAGVEIELSYVATPSIEDKVLIIADTMIATGHSIVDAFQALTDGYGTPRQTFIAGVIASRPGVEFIEAQLPDATIITCALDATLNDKFYIVPGLGDAGDLLYGPKANRQ